MDKLLLGRELMKSAGVTQQDIASALNMSISTVGKYFNGKPTARRTKADIERYLEELRRKRDSSGPEAA